MITTTIASMPLCLFYECLCWSIINEAIQGQMKHPLSYSEALFRSGNFLNKVMQVLIGTVWFAVSTKNTDVKWILFERKYTQNWSKLLWRTFKQWQSVCVLLQLDRVSL